MKKLGILIIGIILSLNSFSQDIQKELLKDIAVISGNKLTATTYQLLTLSDGTTTYQVKSYAEAPATNVISRDNFVSFFALISTEMTKSLTEGQDVVTKDLEEIIGNPDIEINCIMNKTGVQIEVKSSEGTKRFTQTWAELIK